MHYFIRTVHLGWTDPSYTLSINNDYILILSLSENKSGSAAHLVENEIPISTSSVTIKDDPLTPLNSISQREPPPLPHNGTSVDELQIHHPASSRSKVPRTENVYSNVLPVPIGSSRIQPVPGPLKPLRPKELQSWSEPTAHVYSKIEEKMHESIDIFLKSVPYRRRSDADSELGETQLDDLDDVDNDDRTMMTVSDDNDDDDEEININQLVNASPPLTDFNNSRASNVSSKMTLSTSSSSAATAATQIDLRNAAIRPTNPLLTKPMPLQADPALTFKGTVTNNNNSLGSSNSIGNASDIDGSSSIGNNSQSYLVKPAIV